MVGESVCLSVCLPHPGADQGWPAAVAARFRGQADRSDGHVAAPALPRDSPVDARHQGDETGGTEGRGGRALHPDITRYPQIFGYLRISCDI